MTNELFFKEEARNGVLTGIEKVYEAVVATLGPKGRNVIIDTEGIPISTKDGVSVAKAINLEDKLENIGAKLIKEVASKSEKDAADGTTTTTVLARTIAKEGFKQVSAGFSPIEIKTGIELAANDIVNKIDGFSKEVTSNEEIKSVAAISANNDKEIGQLIAEAVEKVGKDGIITVNETRSMETTVKHEEGMELDGGFINAYFVNNPEKMECVFEDPYIFISEENFSSMREILPIADKVGKAGKPFILICEELDGEALGTLIMNNARGTFKCCGVKAPSYGANKKQVLEDLAAMTGGKVFAKEKNHKIEDFTLEDLGKAKLVKIGRNSITIIDGNKNEEAVENRIKSAKGQLEAATILYEKNLIKERIASLTTGIATINVGGFTETEMKEKKYRIDDTLGATKAALEEGIVPGGGIALYRAASECKRNEIDEKYKVGYNIVLKACEEPLRQIAKNAGKSEDIIINQVSSLKTSEGWNALTDEFGDMFNMGIIDPTKVTKCAIRNASSIASILLMTECAITYKTGDNK